MGGSVRTDGSGDLFANTFQDSAGDNFGNGVFNFDNGGNIADDGNGGVLFNTNTDGNNFQIDSNGNINQANSINLIGGSSNINSTGSVSLDSGKFTSDGSGNLTFNSFTIGSGNISTSGNQMFWTSGPTITGNNSGSGSPDMNDGDDWSINGDGSASFAVGNLNIGNNGSLSATSVTTPSLISSGSSPSVSSCGTSPSISGNSVAGKVTVGSGGTATSCAVTFASTLSSTPHCFVNDQTDSVVPRVSTVSTAGFTITHATAFTAGAVIDYFCVQ